ncbi:MAG: C10 family peptidase [Bacteroidales bacterium]|nr:C10 family peptidase [Bacteroidales bacterium]
MTRRLHILLLIGLLLAPSAAQAEDISLDKARKVAESFFNRLGASTRSSSPLILVNADEVAATRSASEVAFYIFNRQGGGFAIVSALDAACPILGYSTDHEFGTGDDMPENLAEWLDLYRQQIAERRKSGKPATAEELARWEEASFPTRADLPRSVNLNTAEWGQGAPFNRLCPLDTNGKKTIAGCTNIAISQVMFYHKHPHHGTGTLPGYTKKGITIPALPLGHEYQWDKMLHKYKGVSYTEEQGDAAARIVYDVAVMGQASFGNSGTATAVSMSKLCTYFGYDKALIRYAHNSSDDASWKAIMKEEIARNLPIVMSGSSASGAAHAFVIDGYDASDRFHINWGWNGSSNGYYQLNAFGSYTLSQVIWTGIKPDDGGSFVYNMSIVTKFSGVTYKGIDYQSGTPTPGSSIKVRFGAVYNYSFTSFSGQYNFGHFSKDGTLKSIMMETPYTMTTLPANTFYGSTAQRELAITQPIERGDYVEALFRADENSEWQHFYNAANPNDNITGQFPLHISDYSTMSYAMGSRKFVISTFTGSKFVITKDGEQVRSGTIGNTNYNINLSDTDKYPPGKYTFTITCGEQSLSFDVIL